MSAAAENNLLAAWRRQLVLEHRRLCWLYKVELATPVFEISEAQGRAGAWSPGFSVLSLAGWLIREHAWEVVIEVLKHEMAHQFVDQRMGLGAEAPHGPAFQEACDRLGVHPAFRTAGTRIPRLPADGGKSTLLVRVEKLFALAASANEHEAALAMEKANAILRRHNLERLAGSPQSGYDCLVLKTGGSRLFSHQRAIAGLLGDFFFVGVVIASQFAAESGRERRVIELTGTWENLAVAEHAYHFLIRRLEHLWQAYREETGAAGREKNSYWLGVLHGFRERLKKQEDAAIFAAGGGEAAGLLRLGDPGLIRFQQARYPRLRTVRHQGPMVFADSYQAGQEEGRQLVIHKGVEEKGGNRGGLLDC